MKNKNKEEEFFKKNLTIPNKKDATVNGYVIHTSASSIDKANAQLRQEMIEYNGFY